MGRSGIVWTDDTWNPVTGCSKVSPGCDHCYAERLARRMQLGHFPRYAQGFEVRFHPETVAQLAHWRAPRRIFVNSMSDLFHGRVTDDQLDQIFAAMDAAPHHHYQILTKRPRRMARYLKARYGAIGVPRCLWVGVSVESPDFLDRLDQLRRVETPQRFMSAEPLLADLGEISLEGIGWLIVGGESGPGFRPLELDWVRRLRDLAVGARVPFFFKQKAGRQPQQLPCLDEVTWNQMPAQMRGGGGAPQAAATEAPEELPLLRLLEELP